LGVPPFHFYMGVILRRVTCETDYQLHEEADLRLQLSPDLGRIIAARGDVASYVLLIKNF
jgi:hypothetical protein